VRERGAGRGARGFVLVATLWILAAITIAAAFFAEEVDRSRELARRAQLAAQGLADMESTRAEILFRFATTDLSIEGLGPRGSAMRLDDHAYRGTGGDLVRLQDHRGLFNVNYPDREMLARLIGQFGVPPERRDPMIDALLDFIDVDDFRRLNGAEARQYADAGLPPPANDWLSTPHQLRSVYGWREQGGLWASPRFLQVVTAARVGVFNPNTAPVEVLASLRGSSAEIAAAIVRQRQAAPLYSWEPIGGLTGFPPEDVETVVWVPGDSVRVTQQARNVPWVIQYGVTLTPASPNAPWRIDYHAKSAAAVPIDDEKDVSPLPARIAQPAAGAATL
jgi:DNA uptake protein ComE-like DNA-binding protein